MKVNSQGMHMDHLWLALKSLQTMRAIHTQGGGGQYLHAGVLSTTDSLSEFHVSHKLLHNGVSALLLWYPSRVEI